MGELGTTLETVVLLRKLQSTHYAEGELKSDKPVEIYNLDVIISVGYRVKFKRGTRFRIQAVRILKEYMRKGFALDD